jgi:3-hydroxypropanoate dehydrogenase
MAQLPKNSAAIAVPLPDAALDQLFRTARSHSAWLDRPVSSETVRELYELTKWGPTSANSTPARFVFIRTPAAKERLKPYLTRGNVEKTMTAPCCVIIAYDTRFYDELPKLYPPRDMRSVFAGNAALIEDSARRNSTLQGAYLMLAARALGLDCGPMSGFNSVSLDAEFFPDGRWKANFLCCIGYGCGEQLAPRNPRLDFTEACLDL